MKKPIRKAYMTCVHCMARGDRLIYVAPECPQGELCLGTFVARKERCDGSCLHYRERRKR